MKRYDNPLWAFLASLVFLLLFSWSTSPLYLTFGGDSPFFQTIGLGITQGKVPYVDLFDHKGPVAFFMDALGYSLGLGRLGLFIVQVISFTIALILFYKIAQLFTTTKKSAFWAVALAFIPLMDFITEGNQVEEWELPWIAAALLMACKHALSKRREALPLLSSLAFGFCFAVVFLVRPNDGVMWVGSLYFGLFIMWIAQKRPFGEIFAGVIAFLIGTALATLPFFLYFSAHNALADWWFGMIQYNLQYAGDALFTWGGIGMMLIPMLFVGVILLLTTDKKQLKYLFVTMLLLTLVLIGKRDYYHYLIPFTPFIVVCFALCFERRFKLYLWVVCILFVGFGYRECSFMVRAFELRPVLTEFYSQTDALFENVPEEERNSIWNYNLVTYYGDKKPHLVSLMGAFPHARITPSSPILAAYDLYYMEDRFGILNYEPEWLVFNPEDDYQKDIEYINENYELVASTPSEPVCEIQLYKKK